MKQSVFQHRLIVCLPAEKIIAFYNETLNGFWAGEREVRVRPASEIHFAQR
jgi:hypothetical protein